MRTIRRLGRFPCVLGAIILTLVGLFGALPLHAEVFYLPQVIPLMPRDSQYFEVQAESELGRRIDQLTLKILSTPTGRVFCGAVDANLISVKRAFFLNEESARKALKVCQGAFVKKMLLPVVPFQKKFVIIETSQEDFRVDGWTSPRNETYLFLNKRDQSDQRLLRILSHEMAVSFDRKELIAWYGKMDWAQIGLSEDQESCAVHQVLRDVLIKHTFTSIRAFEMESRISQELGLMLPRGLKDWARYSCVEKFRFMQPYVVVLNEAVQAEQLVSTLMGFPLNKCLEPSEQISTLEQLAAMTLKFTDGRVENLCEFMSRATPYYPGFSMHGGPGPRIGGGWERLPVLSPMTPAEGKAIVTEVPNGN